MLRQRCASLLLLAAGVGAGSSPAAGPELQEVAGKSHYVATGGDDAGPGSKTQPWKTLGRLANLTLAPGDTIYLTSGDTWAEQLTLGAAIGDGMAGCMDKATGCAGGNCSIVGWAVNSQAIHAAAARSVVASHFLTDCGCSSTVTTTVGCTAPRAAKCPAAHPRCRP